MRRRLAGVCLALACAASAGWAGSLNYCQSETELAVGVQDRLMQVAGLVKAELDRSGQRVALVARSGLALQRLDQRYSCLLYTSPSPRDRTRYRIPSSA
mgnify:CR=1 FL=1